MFGGKGESMRGLYMDERIDGTKEGRNMRGKGVSIYESKDGGDERFVKVH